MKVFCAQFTFIEPVDTKGWDGTIQSIAEKESPNSLPVSGNFDVAYCEINEPYLHKTYCAIKVDQPSLKNANGSGPGSKKLLFQVSFKPMLT